MEYRDAIKQVIHEAETAFADGESVVYVEVGECGCMVTEEAWPTFKEQLIDDMRKALH